MKKTIFIFLLAILMLIIPNVVKADDVKPIFTIWAWFKQPVEGENPNFELKVSRDLFADYFETDMLWYADSGDGNKVLMSNTDVFKAGNKYSLIIKFKRPKNYIYVYNEDGSLNVKIEQSSDNKFNGTLTPQVEEDENYYYDTISYDFGTLPSNVIIKTIDITIPDLKIGDKLFDRNNVTLKVNKEETFGTDVFWNKYNEETKEYDIDITDEDNIVKKGKYEVDILFQPKINYIIDSNTKLMLNGENIPLDNQIGESAWQDRNKSYIFKMLF